jgi:hypothetical protein
MLWTAGPAEAVVEAKQAESGLQAGRAVEREAHARLKSSTR